MEIKPKELGVSALVGAAGAVSLGETPQTVDTFHSGDSVQTLLMRNGLTRQQLQQANPGVALDRLTAGTAVNIPATSSKLADAATSHEEHSLPGRFQRGPGDCSRETETALALQRLGIDPASVRTVAGPGGPVPDTGAHQDSGFALDQHRIQSAMRDVMSRRNDMPEWPIEWQNLTVAKDLGLTDRAPTDAERHAHPLIAKYENSKNHANERFHEAAQLYGQANAALTAGDKQKAVQLFRMGQALQADGAGFAADLDKLKVQRCEHIEKAFAKAIKSELDLGVSTMVWAAPFAGLRLFQARQAINALRMAGSTEEARTLNQILSNSETLKNTEPQVLCHLSKERITIQEAQTLCTWAKTAKTSQDLITSEGEAIRLLALNRCATGAANPELQKLLDPRNSAELVQDREAALSIVKASGGEITTHDAGLIVSAAENQLFREVDAMRPQHAIARLRQQGLKGAADLIENFGTELRGHHYAVVHLGEEINANLPRLRGATPEELMAAVPGLDRAEAQALRDLVTSFDGEVHYPYHDMTGPAGKDKTWIMRNLGKPKARTEENDPNFKLAKAEHNRFGHHIPVTPQDKIEQAADVIPALRQRRAYKDPFDWKKVDAIVSEEKDVGQRAIKKVAVHYAKQLERGGMNWEHPEQMLKDPSQFEFPTRIAPDDF